MVEKNDDKEIAFDSVTWEAQKFDAVERKFQEVCVIVGSNGQESVLRQTHASLKCEHNLACDLFVVH